MRLGQTTLLAARARLFPRLAIFRHAPSPTGWVPSEKGEVYVTNYLPHKNEAGTSPFVVVISESLYVQAPKTLGNPYNIE